LLLFNVYVANAVACYQRWQRSSTAVNMTSVWKRSIVSSQLLFADPRASLPDGMSSAEHYDTLRYDRGV